MKGLGKRAIRVGQKIKIHKFSSIYGSPTVYSDIVYYALKTALKKNTTYVFGGAYSLVGR